MVGTQRCNRFRAGDPTALRFALSTHRSQHVPELRIGVRGCAVANWTAWGESQLPGPNGAGSERLTSRLTVRSDLHKR
jgi:hypothetical protein